MTTPRDATVLTRNLVTQSNTPNKIPSVATATAFYKGEIQANTYAANSSFISTSAGLFLRVGSAAVEDPGDSVIRIGPAYVTNDATNTTEPGITFTGGTTNYCQVGQLWFRTTDKAFFLYDGTAWEKLTAVPATHVVPGIVRLATEVETIAGVSDTTSITPLQLKNWRQAYDFITPIKSLLTVHVNDYIGDDSIENTGTNEYKPFKTIERALLEVARASYQVLPDASKVLIDEFATVIVEPGNYIVDNGLGAGNYSSITQLANGATGPVQPYSLAGTIASYNATTSLVTVTTSLSTYIYAGLQIFNSAGGKAIISEVTSGTTFYIREITGTWASSQTLSIAQYNAFNSPNGGVIVPKGCSIVARDLRKTKISPKYVPQLYGSSYTADQLRTALFRVTGGAYIAGLSFVDNPNVLYSHHLVHTIAFASADDLSDVTSGYYAKIYQAFVNLVTPVIDPLVLGTTDSEDIIATNAASSGTTDSNGYRIVDSASSASPYVFNCTVRSRFGLSGIYADGSLVGGLSSMVTAQFTQVSLQVDPHAFTTTSGVPGGKVYNEPWRHYGFRATNNAYMQIVSCFTIGVSVGYQADAGGELSITNSCTDFGDISLRAIGYSGNILTQDTGGTVATIIPPKPIPTSNTPIYSYSFVTANTTANKIYVQGTIGNDIIYPYTFQNGESIYVTNGSTEYAATLATTGAVYASDVNGYYFITETALNGIFTNAGSLNGYPIYIRRSPDTRTPDDRIYWLKLEGLTSVGQRPPILNYILQFDPTNMVGFTLNHTLFVASSKSTDSTGADLPAGTYYIALLSADSTGNDTLANIYPPINTDAPLENSPTSLTYIATKYVLQSLGLSAGAVTALLQPSATEVSLGLVTPIYPDFVKPSLIRTSNHTWEWAGYGNYSSALPKFQTTTLTFAQSLAHIKSQINAGRIYNTGMDQDGNFYLGDQIIDLKTGESLNGSGTANNSPVFKQVTITDRLLMLPSSTVDFRSTRFSIDSLTTFVSPIQPGAGTYATQTQAGFIELATDAEVSAAVDTQRAITPSQIPLILGANFYSTINQLISTTANVRMSLSYTDPEATGVTSTSIIINPYNGNGLGLYNVGTSRWELFTLSKVGLDIAAAGGNSSDTTYDVYVYNNSGNLAMELIAWSGSSPVNRSLLNFVYVKNGEPNKRLLGTVRTSTGGTSEITLAATITGSSSPRVRCLLSNLYNSKDISLKINFGTAFAGGAGTSDVAPAGFGLTSRIDTVNWTTTAVTGSSSISWNGGSIGTSYYDPSGTLQSSGSGFDSANTSRVSVGINTNNFYTAIAATANAVTCAVCTFGSLVAGFNYFQYSYGDSNNVFHNGNGDTYLIVNTKY